VKRVKYLLAAVVTAALLVVAFQAYSMNSRMKTPSSASFAPADVGINYPNPISPNVTVVGVMTSSVISPACSLSNPPCAYADDSLYYISVSGWNYRLIFPNSTKVPVNHARILVTGVFVTPSSYQANLWTPQMYFRGDIYVLAYTYVSPYY